ncbi:hypothetical protein WN48_11244 [Eufriesea mexicana]|uniref:Large ribosomal subunit protein bL36m n=1 Tax=Eufriesea mexicana TaxID=516756 RepID=A0A310SDP2_9HYME|nr:hypothetical protein WN48_11244 [Eufriesea mexicana]
MNLCPLLWSTCKTLKLFSSKIPSMEPFSRIINCNMHYICNEQYTNNLSSTCTNKITSILLQPALPMYNVTCGLKMKTILKRRCKSCLLITKNDRKYILCKERPRHNQVERKKSEYKTWILTHATQGKRKW